jgi:hypothetical protein
MITRALDSVDVGFLDAQMRLAADSSSIVANIPAFLIGDRMAELSYEVV